uniref:EGF-like domain-containing protein n=1 Tax=Laticauda laticaudata TaxID=8630 RepID=A0A8C5RRU2_LATLA
MIYHLLLVCILRPYALETNSLLDCMDPTCSGRGVCVRGECHCSVGWGGANCETPRATCLDQCSGHGTFLSETSLCTCDPNWTGHDCSTEICAADCGVHGTCFGGSCRCEEGWMGAACDQRACHPRCNEHGTCRDGKCECSPGWNGEHCTIGKRKKLGRKAKLTKRVERGYGGQSMLSRIRSNSWQWVEFACNAAF